MKLNSVEHTLQRSGLSGERNFGIALSPKIYSLLSDKLYTDRIGSVVREVCSNAWDAQKYRAMEEGTEIEPFSVTLPTNLEPHFIVEDTGPGMPDEVAQGLFSTLGASTKENSNDQIGAFGLGSKSPFAVTDTFTVENTYEGVTHFYLCFKAENGLPSLLKTGERKEGRKNGVKVIIPAPGHQYSEYVNALNRQLIVMEPKPIITNKSAFDFKIPAIQGNCNSGFLLCNAHEFNLTNNRVYARMGMVLYPIDVNQLSPDHRQFCRFIKPHTCIVLHFNIGDLEPVPSREALSYDNASTMLINERMKTFLKEYILVLRKEVEDQPTPLDAWDRWSQIIASIGYDVFKTPIYNLGFVIDNKPIFNAFPQFNYEKENEVVQWFIDGEEVPLYKVTSLSKDGDKYFKVDENDEKKEVEVTNKTSLNKVSESDGQFYYEEYFSADKRLNIARTNKPYRYSSFSALNDIVNGTQKFLLFDEVDPSFRVSRMRSWLSDFTRPNEKRHLVRVHSRYPGSKTDFSEFIKSLERLHPGITKIPGAIQYFSDIKKPVVQRKERVEGASKVPGVSIYGGEKGYREIDVTWDQLEELLEDYSDKIFYIKAYRNDVIGYDGSALEAFKEFTHTRGFVIVIVRKSGESKLDQIKQLGISEFGDFINKRMDNYVLPESERKLESAIQIASKKTEWYRYAFKEHMNCILNKLKEEGEYIHPFFKLWAEVENLRFRKIENKDEEYFILTGLRVNKLIKHFYHMDWHKRLSVDISEDFEKLEKELFDFYPALSLLIRQACYDPKLDRLKYQYMKDYNQLRGMLSGPPVVAVVETEEID